MLTELYIGALLADEPLADEVWALWDAGVITDDMAAWAWRIVAHNMPNDSIDLTHAAFRCVGRHFVTLSCVQELDAAGKENIVLVSGFVAEIADYWVYLTAGHVLQEFEQAVNAGAKLDVWRLGDHAAGNKFKNTGIPFDFTVKRWIVIENEENGLDYAATILEDNYRRLLEAGGTEPLRRDAWGNHVIEHDHWALIGVPAESVAYDGRTNISARLVFIPLDSSDTPSEAGSKSQNQFYGRLRSDSITKVRDLRGLSGSPIFAFRKFESEWRYWVIGVQSAWYRNSKIVVACPFSTFAEELEAAIQRAIEELTNGKDHEQGPA